jgi:chemotaxis protein MotB
VEIGKLPNTVTMEGHTDAKAYAGKKDYSNWELSADRANAARRWMQANGMREDQVTQVRGFADQSLRNKDDPEDASNRRVTLIIQYKPGELAGGAGASGAHGSSGAGAGASAQASAAAGKPAPFVDSKKK